MTIIVGRGRSKATQRIEITDPTVSREHCRLTDNGDGTYMLENVSQQGTFVDGKEVIRTSVTPETKIKMGNLTVKVADLLPLQPEAPKEYSLQPLKAVWDTYHNTLLDIQKRQRTINQLRSASPMFTLGSGAIASLAKALDWSEVIFFVTILLTIVGLGLMAYCFVKGLKDKSIEEREEATERFTRDYVCPNPDCRHFMGNQSYDLLVRQNKSCPYCKCKFTEK